MIKLNSLAKKVLVVGAYGLIGHGVSKRLLAEGYLVAGLGRNLQAARRVLPNIHWIEQDIRCLTEVATWREILEDFSTVVNCSGALQGGPDDDLEIVHHKAVAALAQACAVEDIGLIQISAVGAKPDASTHFLASKGLGDAAIKAAGGDWHIFRPGLVLASNAYGGTTMLRMLAAFPWVQPIAKPATKIQTISLDDVASVVVAATNGDVPNGTEIDLVEPQTHSLRDVVLQIRHWLGFPFARFEVPVPDFGVTVVSKIADALSWLGWRSPLRSTAMRVLSEGVQGVPEDLGRFGLTEASTLSQTLSQTTVSAQDRLFARMSLLAPIILACLSGFWLASGIIAIARVQEAAQVLRDAGWSVGLAIASVLFWAVVDIAIGIAFAFRKYARAACWMSVSVSLFYLVASTIAVPSLWIDPLGPLIKVVPAIVLALVARVVLDTR